MKNYPEITETELVDAICASEFAIKCIRKNHAFDLDVNGIKYEIGPCRLSGYGMGIHIAQTDQEFAPDELFKKLYAMRTAACSRMRQN